MLNGIREIKNYYFSHESILRSIRKPSQSWAVDSSKAYATQTYYILNTYCDTWAH